MVELKLAPVAMFVVAVAGIQTQDGPVLVTASVAVPELFCVFEATTRRLPDVADTEQLVVRVEELLTHPFTKAMVGPTAPGLYPTGMYCRAVRNNKSGSRTRIGI